MNSITVNGQGQQGHSRSAVGEITRFETTADFDFLEGEAAPAYKGKLTRFTRRILFAKPDAIIIHDLLEAPSASTFEWLLHAPVEMSINGQTDVRVVNDKAACRAAFLYPPNLELSQTDQFDPPPRERIKLVEYHLTAKTPGKQASQQFVTLLRPYRSDSVLVGEATLRLVRGGFDVTVPVRDGQTLRVLLNGGSGIVRGADLLADGLCSAVVTNPAGGELRRFVVGAE